TIGKSDQEAGEQLKLITADRRGTGKSQKRSDESGAEEATTSRKQKPAKTMLKKPPPPRDKADEAGAERVTVTGDRVGRPPMEKVRHRRQK
ncbi:unnamed protein product, partial [Brassica rapa]